MSSPTTVTDADLIWQQCLFAFEEPRVTADFSAVTRTWLDDTSWVDYFPQWLGGADLVFAELVALGISASIAPRYREL